MLRVLQVVTHMNRGGLETMLMNYYRNIDRTQIQFDFLTHRTYIGDYGEEILSLGGKIYHLPVLNPFSINYKQKLREFFKQHREYHIIHVHQDCLSSVILKIAEQEGIRIRIAHSHNSSQDKNIKYLVKMYYRRQIPQYATHLLACSEQAGKWMYGNGSFSVLNNAINAKEYRFNPHKREKVRNTFHVENNEMLIGHVGRFNYSKNHSFLIDVFQNVQKKLPAKLMLIGDGELRKQIEKKVQNNNLGDKIIFTGVRSDVADLMQAMDVFVFPSNYEGLPVTIIEAQASGLPCLISDKVPIECKVTDYVQQIDLTKSTEQWAECAIRASKIKRKDTCEEIKKAGFDIKENVKLLQKFYFGFGE